MTALVLTAVGDDRTGLVDALAAAVVEHGGNWDRSQISRLGGKFAGVALVSVPDDRVDGLRAALDRLGADGILDVSVVAADGDAPVPASAMLSVSGTDRPGVLREMTQVLAENGVSVESLDTSVDDAPMAGGQVFEAAAALVVPDGVDLEELRAAVDNAIGGFLVEIEPILGA